MENYHFESQIEETSKLMREWYEGLIPETLRNLDRQITKLSEGQIGLIFFKDGNIKGSLTTKYNANIVDRLKNVHYFYGKKPAWNPRKKRWEIEIDFLPKIIFAFPNFELSPSLIGRFPSIKEIQENGTAPLPILILQFKNIVSVSMSFIFSMTKILKKIIIVHRE